LQDGWAGWLAGGTAFGMMGFIRGVRAVVVYGGNGLDTKTQRLGRMSSK